MFPCSSVPGESYKKGWTLFSLERLGTADAHPLLPRSRSVRRTLMNFPSPPISYLLTSLTQSVLLLEVLMVPSLRSLQCRFTAFRSTGYAPTDKPRVPLAHASYNHILSSNKSNHAISIMPYQSCHINHAIYTLSGGPSSTLKSLNFYFKVLLFTL